MWGVEWEIQNWKKGNGDMESEKDWNRDGERHGEIERAKNMETVTGRQNRHTGRQTDRRRETDTVGRRRGTKIQRNKKKDSTTDSMKERG